jgi:arylsulfatase
VAAVRYDHWKMVFMEQRKHGFDVWQEPLVTLRLPKLFNLCTDPFERADHEGMGYSTWRFDRASLLRQPMWGNGCRASRSFSAPEAWIV